MHRMNRRSRLGTLLALAYLVVFLLAQCFTVAALKSNPANSEMSGIVAVLVTLPWSLILVPVWNALGYVEWYNKFANSPGLYGLLGTMALLPGAIVNAAIAYWIGRAIEGRVGRRAA
jgi:hypothetical protein